MCALLANSPSMGSAEHSLDLGNVVVLSLLSLSVCAGDRSPGQSI